MRARLALCVLLIAAAGCETTGPHVTTDTEAQLVGGRFVTLPRLARNLRLSYHGEERGLIELSAPPDHVMLVEESTRALVNGQALSMTHPCVRLGDEFALRSEDADKLGSFLARLRSERIVREPVPKPVPVASPRPVPLPAGLRPSVPARPWRYIVIHHQAAARGSAAKIHRDHLARGMDGLGYHFVIGNGSLSGDGEIEVGYRWREQVHGAHARVRPGDDNRWNNFGVGICLVGDFCSTAPSQKQMEALVRLVRRLRIAYNIPARRVVPHGFVKKTICPGPKFPWAEFHARIR